MDTCSIADCESAVRARGWCNIHWQRWYRTGDPLGKWHRTHPCSIPACDKPAAGRGWCKAHWAQWSKYGDPLGRAERKSAFERFWEKVEVSPGCWLWLGARSTNGYGHFWTGSRQVPAHVWAYEQKYGVVPVGLELDHVHERGCRFRNCVRPAHLEAVTHVENLRRAHAVRALKMEEVA